MTRTNSLFKLEWMLERERVIVLWWCRARPNRGDWNREGSKGSPRSTRLGAEWRRSQGWWCRKAWSIRRRARRHWRSLCAELRWKVSPQSGSICLPSHSFEQRERESYGGLTDRWELGSWKSHGKLVIIKRVRMTSFNACLEPMAMESERKDVNFLKWKILKFPPPLFD